MNKNSMCALMAFLAGCMNIPMAIINFISGYIGTMFISLGFMMLCWGIALYILGLNKK